MDISGNINKELQGLINILSSDQVSDLTLGVELYNNLPKDQKRIINDALVKSNKWHYIIGEKTLMKVLYFSHDPHRILRDFKIFSLTNYI